MEQDNYNVARHLSLKAVSHPALCAVRYPIKKVSGQVYYKEKSFEELEKDANIFAKACLVRGLKRGMRVLLMVKPGVDLVVSVFGLFKIGAIPIVIDPGMGIKNFIKCVRQSKPEALIGIKLANIITHCLYKSFCSLRIRIDINSLGFKTLLKSCSHAGPILANAKKEDLAAILFTSGSTGAPKGVCYEHGMFEAQLNMLQKEYNIQEGEIDLPMLPVFVLFNPALGMTTVVPMMNPSRPARVNPKKIVDAIIQNNVTNSFGSPVLWKKISEYCVKHEIILPSLKRVLIAGAPVSYQVIELMKTILPNGEVFTPYGATEVLPVSSISGSEILEETWKQTEMGKGTCVGHPIMSAKIIRITDEKIEFWKDDLELTTGEIGEIVVSGLSVTTQYDHLEDATERAKIKDKDGSVWHRMGDLGYKDTKGRLWFCGRKQERVIIGEDIFYTDCCEGVFNRHENVFRSALVKISSLNSEKPAIVIQPEHGKWRYALKYKSLFIEELKALGSIYEGTRGIKDFIFMKKFPVDVRHNAKIHRLKMARYLSKKVR